MPHWRGGAGGRSVQGHEHDRLPRAALAYFELVQPRFGEGPLEDARPPRFANFVGTVLLGAAPVAYATGADPLGTVLGGLVAGLALLAAVTRFCAGCEAFKLGHLLTGRRFEPCP